MGLIRLVGLPSGGLLVLFVDLLVIGSLPPFDLDFQFWVTTLFDALVSSTPRPAPPS